MKLCACCFGDEEIKQFIISSAKGKIDCKYCGQSSEYIEIDELLDFFSEFFSIFIRDEKGVRFSKLLQEDWNLFSVEINQKDILSDILNELGIDLVPTDYVSYIPDIKNCVDYWEVLKEDLKWNRRFLIESERLMNLQWDTLFDVPITIDAENKLYRARIHTDGSLKPFGCDNMGCPPKEKTVVGRANPYGVRYLYLCNDIETPLYETRGSYPDIVSIGTFELKDKEPLNIVDFTQKQSPFNNEISNDSFAFVKGKLLRQKISYDLSKPMRRFDSELEYVPTQFICEFIRYVVGARGIQFNSSIRKGGVNVVLFDPDVVKCIEEKVYRITNIQIQSKDV